MPAITPDEVAHLAVLARRDLTPEPLGRLRVELDVILPDLGEHDVRRITWPHEYEARVGPVLVSARRP